MSLADPSGFFTHLRSGLLGPTLSPDDVAGAQALLAACEDWPLAHVAYALATAYHETAHSLRPVKERGGEAYFRRMYDPLGDRPKVAAQLGNTRAGDGARFCGRGYVQLTGRTNYARAGKATGHPLVEQPDLACRLDIAAVILRFGMAEGWFTGKRLGDYLPIEGHGSAAAFKAARRVINGSDKDILISGYAARFQSALMAGGWGRVRSAA